MPKRYPLEFRRADCICISSDERDALLVDSDLLRDPR
jgi:hypothetical protein